RHPRAEHAGRQRAGRARGTAAHPGAAAVHLTSSPCRLSIRISGKSPSHPRSCHPHGPVLPPSTVNAGDDISRISNTDAVMREPVVMSVSEQRAAGDREFQADERRVASGTELLTVAEVSTILRVSKMTIYRMVHAGEIPHVRVGRSFRIPVDAVRQILGGRIPGER